MTGRRRSTRNTRRTVPQQNTSETHVVPRDVYGDMLAEAGVGMNDNMPERPLKRRRARQHPPGGTADDAGSADAATEIGAKTRPALDVESEDEEEGIEFEDVVIPKPTLQTMFASSDEEEEDEEDEDEGLEFEDVDLSVPPTVDESTNTTMPKNLELNLTAQRATLTPARRGRGAKRKPLTRAERELRVQVHKAHVLCLLHHAAARNRWCDDAEVQARLRPLLTDRMVGLLNPRKSLSQYGRTEALKEGLRMAGDMFKLKYQVTERGMRKALWAEDVQDLSKYELPPDLETCMDKPDFLKAARTLQGSRDVGAQLYCALLRAAGVRTRLVCSLQPLSPGSAGPTLPKPRNVPTRARRTTATSEPDEPKKESSPGSDPASTPGPSSRRRLGLATSASRYRQTAPAPTRASQSSPSTPRKVKESQYPVYWVEVLDVAHQKWQPADPLATKTSWRPRALEPPLTDRENVLSYVVAFDEDGTVRDVTQRYAKFFTAKTRRLRVEHADPEGGRRWWRRALKRWRARRLPTDLEQIEDNELAAAAAREPVPRNIADFKGHPLYVLERHLRRAEVLVPGAKDVGTAAAGPRAPLERIYLRRDVRVARSRDKWYRMGRVVRPNEIPAKWLPPQKKNRMDNSRDGDGNGDVPDVPGSENGTPLFLMEHTDEFKHPPVMAGRVPKNKFGNIDVYVPSMVPAGGAHVADELAARAAYVLGVDYAPALTGFRFKGRRGTAVLSGVVVAAEHEEAVRAVVRGFADVEAEMEEERRRRECLKVWRRLLMGLRVRERIWAGVDEEAEAADVAGDEARRSEELDKAIDKAMSDVSEEYVIEEEEGDYGAGGFFAE